MKNTTLNQSNSHDICIIGGGIVGLTLAALLARQTSLQIAVIENKIPDLEWQPQSIDLRVSAINRASERILRFTDVWKDIEKLGISVYQRMMVWDQVSAGIVEFKSSDVAEANLGYIIEHRVLLKALYQNLLTTPQIKFYCPNKPQALTQHADHLTVELENIKLQTKLLVGADGAHSWVREKCNIVVTEKSYHHEALVTTVRAEKPHQQTAWQCFSKEGPVALLPLQNPRHCSIVWSAIPDYAKVLKNMSAQDFNKTLSDIFFKQLGKIEKLDTLVSFPLFKRHVKNYVQPQVVLVGDAAHTIHPLAGQGVNLGLLDAACLAQVIVEALQKNREFNELNTLRRYERWRKSDNWEMIAAMDVFKNLFSHSNATLNPIRRWSLNIVDRFGFLKTFFIRRALGVQGDLPKVCYEKFN